MDTDLIYRAVCTYGSAKRHGWEYQSGEYLEHVKHLLNEADAERQELLATNERLVDEVAELKQRVAGLEANEKVLLAQVQGHTQWREKIINASVSAYGESAIRYKFSLTKSGKCMNTFPREIDGRWFALTPAEDDGHIGHIARIHALTDENAELKAKLTDKASLLRGCYARIDKLEKALRELHDATQLVSVGNYDQEAHDIAVSRARAALEKKHRTVTYICPVCAASLERQE